MIYLLKAEQDSETVRTGWIKIGTTARLSVRLREIAIEIGHMPTVLAVLDGAFAEEHALHVRFKGVRCVGEWFHPHADLLRLIETEGRPWDGVDETKKTESTKIDPDVLRDARIVVAVTGEGLSEYLSKLLRPLVTRDKEQALDREKGGSHGKKKPDR